MVALSPEEIENKTFPAVVRGYERSAVDGFLRQVADEVRRLQAAAARAAAPPPPTPTPDEVAARLGVSTEACIEAMDARTAAGP